MEARSRSEQDCSPDGRSTQAPGAPRHGGLFKQAVAYIRREAGPEVSA